MLRLRKIFDVEGIPVSLGAAALGISEKTLYNKLAGASEFTYSEFCRLRELFPKYNIDFLLTAEPSEKNSA